ncbi:IS3 family transposase [Actinomadura madurae]
MPEFTASRRTKYGIPHAVACRALEVSQSWLYRWIKRRLTAREQRRNRLDEQIQRLFTASGGTYGSPRIARDLRDEGRRGVGQHRRRSDGRARPGRAGTLTAQVADAPGKATGGTGSGAPQLRRGGTGCAVVRGRDADRHRRGAALPRDDRGPVLSPSARPRHVGHHDAALVAASLQMAAATRGGDVDGVIFHTDRGAEYTAAKTAAACRRHG